MRRDKYDIIVQTAVEDPNYEDGGDSAFSTGLMAFSGSSLDLEIMPEFIKDNQLVRHPYQPVYNDPKETSRDQVLAFFAGPSTNTAVNSACYNYAKNYFVNKDILMPNHRYYLHLMCGAKPSLLLTALAHINQALALLWDCYIKPNDEKNQAIVMNAAFGPRWLKFLYDNHPGLFKNVDDYFNGWRDRTVLGLRLKLTINEIVGGKNG